MTDTLLRMLLWITLGLVLVLLLRRSARQLFGAGPAFTLWLLPFVLALAPLLPQQLAPSAMVVLPGFTVTPYTPVAAVAHAGSGIEVPLLLLALWLVGVAISLARLVWHYVRLSLGAQRGSPTWLATVCGAMPSLDARRVRVHAHGPAVLWSLPHSLLLLPEDFARRFDTVEARELVLRHELTHARRGDAWWCLAMEIVSALLWFHPLTWLARPRFRLDQELACDAASLRAMPSRHSGYARTLLDSVATQPMPALISWLGEPQLKERIAMITRIQPGALRRRTGFLAIALLLAGGLFVAGGQAPAHAAAQAISSSTPPSVDITYKNNHPPRYPVDALQNGVEGMVVVDVSVDAAGHVTGVQVDKPTTTAPASLQAAAVAAAQGWKFKPGEKDGRSVGGMVRIPVNFSLQENSDTSAPTVDVTYKNHNPPRYPAEALHEHEQGLVILDVKVDAEGKVEEVTVDQAKTTAPAVLQTAAIQAAGKWQFNPAMKDGHAVNGTIQVPVNFSLSETPSCQPGFVYKQGKGESFSCVPIPQLFVPPAPSGVGSIP